MKIGDGPAAVTGDENRIMSLPVESGWEGAVSRKIRKSEDLPESCTFYASADRGIYDLEDRKGHPGSMKIGPGFFFTRTLDKLFFREKEHAKRTGTFKDDSSVNQ